MDDVQNDLNILGKEGWELVTVQDISLQDGRMFTVAYLKRQETSRQNAAQKHRRSRANQVGVEYVTENTSFKLFRKHK